MNEQRRIQSRYNCQGDAGKAGYRARFEHSSSSTMLSSFQVLDSDLSVTWIASCISSFQRAKDLHGGCDLKKLPEKASLNDLIIE